MTFLGFYNFKEKVYLQARDMLILSRWQHSIRLFCKSKTAEKHQLVDFQNLQVPSKIEKRNFFHTRPQVNNWNKAKNPISWTFLSITVWTSSLRDFSTICKFSLFSTISLIMRPLCLVVASKRPTSRDISEKSFFSWFFSLKWTGRRNYNSSKHLL